MKKQTSHTEEGQNCPLTYSLHLKLKKQDEASTEETTESINETTQIAGKQMR